MLLKSSTVYKCFDKPNCIELIHKIDNTGNVDRWSTQGGGRPCTTHFVDTINKVDNLVVMHYNVLKMSTSSSPVTIHWDKDVVFIISFHHWLRQTCRLHHFLPPFIETKMSSSSSPSTIHYLLPPFIETEMLSSSSPTTFHWDRDVVFIISYHLSLRQTYRLHHLLSPFIETKMSSSSSPSTIHWDWDVVFIISCHPSFRQTYRLHHLLSPFTEKTCSRLLALSALFQLFLALIA